MCSLIIPPTAGHGMFADGSVGSGSKVTVFPVVRSESVIFLACCGISHVVLVCGLSYLDLTRV